MYSHMILFRFAFVYLVTLCLSLYLFVFVSTHSLSFSGRYSENLHWTSQFSMVAMRCESVLSGGLFVEKVATIEKGEG